MRSDKDSRVNVHKRNNVQVRGDGPATMVFAHGLGCDQTMWRKITPAFEDAYRIVLFDLVGCGASDACAWDKQRHRTLHGYADDLLEILDAVADRPVVYVGHSVSSMIGLLAANRSPGRIASLLMLAPSPRYINDATYEGGFSQEDIDGLLETIDSNYLGWSSAMAPTLMGAPEQPELGIELERSFHRTEPDIAKAFARTTFLSDHRADIASCSTPALIMQCTEDVVVPRVVGEYMHAAMPHSRFRLIDNTGHYPHLSSPDASIAAIKDFLAERQAA